ncbi:3' terminal RNA ribose 2'-O-methyltransferase Hen1 [Nocardia flavorosea]|uniref:Small RNA 2'-O-methyltransferase n=1 Tax=Nocardia flavorosea TaxID=53429 RepID=A0A846YS95_9NOCA|nr:3' terminal RNA ribose 2'-O-methyltransferase Hen1 [Nocardia flavorosea]NKY59849.1 3' terminal RNA ribose 2'-O-methyltransferase Hen1 [Nocardia flavorosea]
MLLTITCTPVAGSAMPATDLGFLLHKNPDRVQEFGLSYGIAHVLYPQATAEGCTAALLLEVDPVRLVRGRAKGPQAFALGQYVNDRPYAASSLLSVAIGAVFRSALRGECTQRPELARTPLPLRLELPALGCRGGPELAERVFAPLGWSVDATPLPLDPAFPAWGDSAHLRLVLTGTVRLADALNHLYVLLPVLDGAKHYWLDNDEVDKLLRAGGSWLAAHPERGWITRRYLARRQSLVRTALARLAELDNSDPEELGAVDEAIQADETTTEPNAEVRRATGPIAPAPSSDDPAPTTPAPATSVPVGTTTDENTRPEGAAGNPTSVGENSTTTASVNGDEPAPTAIQRPPEVVSALHNVTDTPVGAPGDEASAGTTAVSGTCRPRREHPIAAAAVGADDDTPTLPLAAQRRAAVIATLREAGAARVLDLGCGDGALLRELLGDSAFREIMGVDVSTRALSIARRRLRLDRLPEPVARRLTLRQGSLTYTDSALRGFDAAVLMEVIEHIDPPRLPAVEYVVFGAAAPQSVLVTTPNAEYNVRYDGLSAGAFRHSDHRFEWNRAEFRSWAQGIAGHYGYEVRFAPIGHPDPEVGPPTQLAVFTRAHTATEGASQ